MIAIEFFSGSKCGVCHALKPKLFEAIFERFPKVDCKEINVESEPEYAAQQMVFTLPVVIIKSEGKEQFRFARSFGLSQIIEKIEYLEKRHYHSD
jgi:thioredoxin-like negative regulator of GroEL